MRSMSPTVARIPVLFSTAGTKFKKLCMQNKLKLLDASVRHLGTDINYVVLENLYNELKEQVDFFFLTPVTSVEYRRFHVHPALRQE